MIVCNNCRGEMLLGEWSMLKVNGEPTFWCAVCIERYSAAVWPGEEFGPRAPKMHPTHWTQQ